ncbi:ATP phosphoribosyltransferase [archaeon]|jgi:ATP phosphoribosyltransferase|nr:ATP phosphoribosyltransferase [archaeon]MBT3578033.1 ATP phosphoribosyltransferase [archaeon]MBT6819994.1 ATP phosphoribosyltransferase [archaeon]MBT6956296.1 ATP phosphoribosyltransferase [archaeon]MBT7025031.1 ATP phosphoribosyltransferase [archaeon]
MIQLTKTSDEKKIVIGIPKGSLQESTFELFKKAGYALGNPGRSYFPTIDDPEIECVLLRSQEMARYVEDGVLDAGITGYDWVRETNSDVVEIEELIYAKQSKKPVKWVLAVADESDIKSVQDLNGKIVATEVINITKEYLRNKGVNAKVEFSWGATEIKARGIADAIVDVTETGSSLRANNLRIIDTLLESTTRIIANKESVKDSWKKKKIENLAMLLKGVLTAESKVEMLMNVKKSSLQGILNILPAMNTPTISTLSDPEWCDVITVIDKKVARDIIPLLKEAGAEGIVEVPINRIID